MVLSNSPVPQGPKLLDLLRDRIHVKHYSIYTEMQVGAPVHPGSQQSAFARDVGVEEVEVFRLPLAVNGKVAATAQSGAGHPLPAGQPLSVSPNQDV